MIPIYYSCFIDELYRFQSLPWKWGGGGLRPIYPSVSGILSVAIMPLCNLRSHLLNAIGQYKPIYNL